MGLLLWRISTMAGLRANALHHGSLSYWTEDGQNGPQREEFTLKLQQKTTHNPPEAGEQA